MNIEFEIQAYKKKKNIDKPHKPCCTTPQAIKECTKAVQALHQCIDLIVLLELTELVFFKLRLWDKLL